MAVKDPLLTLLEERRGSYLSGEEIAGKLGVTRASVWKAVKALRQEGYAIEAVNNRGYRLGGNEDILSAAGIRRCLGPSENSFLVETFPTVGSTNALLKERAAAGAGEGTVIAASEQTAGRGRFGRSFYSPGNTGLYISLLLRPKLPAGDAAMLTTAAAVAVCKAIEAFSPEQPSIKWVNDVLVRGRKICGILTEAAVDLESGGVDYMIVGTGINVYPPENGFPPELEGIAGPLFSTPQPDQKNQLAASFLTAFMEYYHALDTGAWLSDYRKRCHILGMPILVLAPDGAKEATALDVDDRCRLLVRYPDGTQAALSSGEISVRPR